MLGQYRGPDISSVTCKLQCILSFMIFATFSFVCVRYVNTCLSGGSHTLSLINENGIGESSGRDFEHLVKSMLSFSNLGGVPKNMYLITNILFYIYIINV